MTKRIYYLTSEIIPFAETYELAAFSKGVPNTFIERKFDFRLMMPKYGFISERRYILREVIRLRDMNLKYCNKDVCASVKSAFVPNTKVQVYFLEHDAYFKPTNESLYTPNNDKETNLNSIRFGYFASAALITLNYLRWKPEVIICNDWQMSILPLLIKSGIMNKEYFEDVKIIQVLHSKSELGKYKLSEYKNIGLGDLDEKYAEGDTLDCVASSIPLCDHVLIINRDMDLKEEYEKDPVFKNLFSDYEEKISTYNLESESDEDWEKMADEFVKIIERL